MALALLRLALIAGGSWSNGTNCGSQARNANNSRLNVNANNGCQGQARIRGTWTTPAERQGHVPLAGSKIQDGGAARLVAKAKAWPSVLFSGVRCSPHDCRTTKAVRRKTALPGDYQKEGPLLHADVDLQKEKALHTRNAFQSKLYCGAGYFIQPRLMPMNTKATKKTPTTITLATPIFICCLLVRKLSALRALDQVNSVCGQTCADDCKAYPYSHLLFLPCE